MIFPMFRFRNIFFAVMASLLLVPSLDSAAQPDRREVRSGNRDFRKENYKEAEIDYRKALVKDSLSVAGNYNLANTLYKMGDAASAWNIISKKEVEESAVVKGNGSDFHFNQGDIALAKEDWQAAVDAFKKSLLENPGDIQAKENYIYAKSKLEQQQNQQQNNQDQNQDQNKDQNKDQNQDQNQDQNKDKQNDNQDNQDSQDNQDNQDNDQQNNKDQNQQNNQQSNQPKISPQAAQQMLQAIQAKEKQTQDKVNKQKAQALKSRQKEKNW